MESKGFIYYRVEKRSGTEVKERAKGQVSVACLSRNEQLEMTKTPNDPALTWP